MTKFKINYSLPANYDFSNDEFKVFENAFDEFKKPEIISLKNCRVANNSVAFNYFNIFKESCVDEKTYQNYNKNYNFFLKFIFPQFNFSKKRFFLLTDEWTNNYYHWHLYALQKLMILKEAGLLENSILLLPKRYKKHKFVLPSLKKFGIDEEKIVYLRRKSNIKVKELLTVKPPQYQVELLNQMRDCILQKSIDSNINFGEKIYISRQTQVFRYIRNEEEVVAMLEKYGFKKIIAEKFSYDEQIAICKNAKYLVSPHGAGLTNILFMKKNSNILEFSTQVDKNRPFTEYYKIASILGINYFYQETETTTKIENFNDFFHTIFIVDVKKLEENLKLMLKK